MCMLPPISHLLLVFILTLQVSSIDLNSIEETCKETPFYDLCVLSLKSNPQSRNLDLKGSAIEMGNILLSRASENLDYIRGLIKQATEPQQQRSLAYCAQLYIPIVKYSIPQAVEALSKEHYGFASYGVSDAGNGADSCEKNMSGLNKSPLTERNTLVHNLSAIAVSMIDSLLKPSDSSSFPGRKLFDEMFE